MTVHQLLLEALQNLGEDDFKILKFYLSTKVLDGCKPIAKCHLESAQRIHVVSRVIEYYSEDTAVEICLHVLRKMNQNTCALELEEAYTEYKAPGSASRPAPDAPAGPGTPAGAQITAQTGGVIVAPTVTGGGSGTWNITINKN